MERGRIAQYLAVFALSLSTAAIGTLSGWPTPVIPKINNNETFVDITKDELATLLAMSPPGYVAGSLVNRFITDSLGRRATILASAVPIICGTIITSFARVSWLLYIMHMLWGVGAGMISTVIGIYLAEIVDKDIRATLSTCTKFMFNFGNLMIISIGPFVSYNAINYSLVMLPVVYFAACAFIPESPYYYLKEGKVDHARKSLLKLKDKETAEQELELMKGHVSKEMRNSTSAWELFTGKQYRKPLVIAFGLKLAQIMTGGRSIQQYMGLITQEIGLDVKVSTLLIIFGAFKFAVGVMSSTVIDRVGRRSVLIYSFLSTGICLAIAGLYFFLQEVIRVDHSVLKAYGTVAFIAIILSNGLSIGFNSIIGVISAEIFPLNVKSVAMTSVNVLSGCLGFVVAKSYQAINNVAGFWGVFWAFASIALAGALFSYMTAPETKGKSLEEIQEMLQINTASSDEDEKLSDIEVIEMVENCRESKESRKGGIL
ncbi:facilitated trehalose transporter Tret1-like [Bicyclus anynana]|uniref:Facilitated trehalose transporter Tret1-like n=1 Tax=Bicyclus anynana TaxID=110368 RepID=A0A6J1MUH0_BICAN|nr:facilitated trehalose transporter Tret1-like [Bicyclus anynana]XP_052740297.1 facilitated trehalose transporter Tret1-like [Bicyclus anynana]